MCSNAFSCASISSSWLMSLRNQIKVRAGNRPVYAIMFRGVKSSLSGTEWGPPLNGTSFAWHAKRDVIFFVALCTTCKCTNNTVKQCIRCGLSSKRKAASV